MEETSQRRKKKLTSVGVICELIKNKSQEHYLYGVQSKALLDLDLSTDPQDNCDTEKQLLGDIELLLVEHPQQFKKDKLLIRQSMEVLREKIERLKIITEDVQRHDLKTYRACVLDVEKTMTDLHNRNQLRLGQLKCDHMDIVVEIPEPVDLLREETKFLQRPAKKSIGRRIQQKKRKGIDASLPGPSTSSDYREIREYDQFLRLHGGHTGGWNDEQHSIFLGLKAKYKNNLERIGECFREILPGIDSETIKSHDEWFQEYTCLKNNRKRAIEKWRKSKDDDD